MAHHFSRMPIWENRINVRTLTSFRELVIEYYANVVKGGWQSNYGILEEDRAKELRPEINRAMHATLRAVQKAGVQSNYVITPAPLVRGYVHQTNLITGLFDLQQHRPVVSEQETIDALDRALGVYEAEKWKSWVRTVNPLFWTGLGVEWVATLPFALIGRVGGDRNRAESSSIGKVVMALFLVTGWLAAVTTISTGLTTALYYTGHLEPVLSAIRDSPWPLPFQGVPAEDGPSGQPTEGR